MDFILKVMDYIIFHVLWLGYVFYNTIKSADEKKDDKTIEENNNSYDNAEKNKRHFIHLYTTSSSDNKRPICYMDVYEMFSPLDEERLRNACSKGIVNKTYLKYNKNKMMYKKNESPTWLEYSTLAL